MVSLGGSVTAGTGVQAENAWAARVFDWLAAAFPHEDHHFVNQALPATTSAYAAPCILQTLPHETDLVFLEYSYNDGERLFNRELDQPSW